MTVDLFAILRDLAMGGVTFFIFLWGRDRKQTAEAIAKEFESHRKELEYVTAALHARIDTLKAESAGHFDDLETDLVARFDQASHESSKLASAVQGLIGRVDRMPEDLRDTFISDESCELRIERALNRLKGSPL